ncbi:MAG: hypothetical protein K8S97_00460 [Anaerolineae bacterium]|nr:hypothetical protein [Anaerolineae bacterium]
MFKQTTLALVLMVVIMLVGGALFTATRGEAQSGNALAVRAIGNQRNAYAGTREAASVVVAVTSQNGPALGLNVANFQLSTVLVPPGGCLLEPQGIQAVGQTPGVYRIDIAPISSNPNCAWNAGHYAIGITATQGTQSGASVVDLWIQ